MPVNESSDAIAVGVTNPKMQLWQEEDSEDDEDPYMACFGIKQPLTPEPVVKDDVLPPDAKPKRGRQSKKTAQVFFIFGPNGRTSIYCKSIGFFSALFFIKNYRLLY